MFLCFVFEDKAVCCKCETTLNEQTLVCRMTQFDVKSFKVKVWPTSDSVCGTVGRIIASYTIDLQFESSHRQFGKLSTILNKLFFKDENKEKLGL